MAISREQVQQIIGDGLVELAQQGVLDIGEITSIVNAISNPLIETFEAQAGLSGLPVRTFTKFNPLSDIVANVKHKVSAPLWTDIAGKGFATELTSFFTNSGTDTFTITDKIPAGPSLSDTMPHYINVYDENPDNAATTASAEPNFAIAFGQRLGYGARNNSDSSYEFQYPTRAVYAQYRGLLIGYNDNAFTFGGTDRDDIYVININRARIKEKLDPGNWELRLGGSEQTIRLIDDSGQGLSAIGTANKPLAGGGGRVFNIVSGTIDLSDDDPNFGVPVEAAASRTTYGLAYPDQGIIVLDAVAVSESIGKVADGGTSTEVLYSAANGDTDKTDNNLMNFYRAIQTGSFFTVSFLTDFLGVEESSLCFLSASSKSGSGPKITL